MPAIFVPFNGIPTQIPKTEVERAPFILLVLDQHHAAVKEHMQFLLVQQKERIRLDGYEEIIKDRAIRMMGGMEYEYRERDNGLHWKMKGEEEEELFGRLRAPYSKEVPRRFYELGYLGKGKDVEIC